MVVIVFERGGIYIPFPNDTGYGFSRFYIVVRLDHPADWLDRWSTGYETRSVLANRDKSSSFVKACLVYLLLLRLQPSQLGCGIMARKTATLIVERTGI